MSSEQENSNPITTEESEVKVEEKPKILTVSTNCYFPLPPPPAPQYFCDCSCLAKKIIKTHPSQEIPDVAAEIDDKKEEKKQEGEEKTD